MDDKKKNEDDINSLYEKLYRPELCTEPVTESYKTLKIKLMEQLYKYGGSVVRDKFQNDEEEFYEEEFYEDVVCDSIDFFLKRCENKGLPPIENPKGYYSWQVYNKGSEKLEKIEKLNEKLLSFNSPAKSSNDSQETLEDSLEDDKIETPENRICLISQLREAKAKFSFIEKCYRAKKWPDFLSPMITQHLYKDLHKYFELIYEKNIDKELFSDSIERYTFIDIYVYNLDHAPKAKEIANKLKKTETTVSKAKHRFLNYVFKMYEKVGKVL